MWQCQLFHGKWVKHVSAGGNGQYNETKYWTNPQYTFTINEIDLINGLKSCSVIIGLMQKYTRQKRAAAQVEATEEFIQFRVYKIRNARRSGGSVDSSDLERVGASGSYTNKREVNSRFALSVGTYVIVCVC
jgi:hypothetical protein